MIFAISFLILAVLGGFAYIYKKKTDVIDSQPIEKLATVLEENYRRAIDINHYSINYRSRPPDTIVIVVRHYRDVNRKNMNDAIDSGKNMVHGMAKDIYGMDYLRVGTDVEMVEMPDPAPKSDSGR